MNYIIVDLEATCWERGTVLAKMEIIEIGAVKLNEDLTILDEFCSFVRPVVQPALSDFCQKLTSISQHDVDSADDFQTVFSKFCQWIGREPYYLCSWGAYDFKQFQCDCKRHHIPFPFLNKNHINLKKLFADTKHTRCGMAQALNILGLPLIGTHHRGIDDARNISTIAQILLASKSQ